MRLPDSFERKTVSSVLEEHPAIGEILTRHHIDCVACGSTSCLFKNVIATHTYDPQKAIEIEKEIFKYLTELGLR